MFCFCKRQQETRIFWLNPGAPVDKRSVITTPSCRTDFYLTAVCIFFFCKSENKDAIYFFLFWTQVFAGSIVMRSCLCTINGCNMRMVKRRKTWSAINTSGIHVIQMQLFRNGHFVDLELKSHSPCLEPLRSALGPVLGVYLVSRVAALCRVQSKSSFLSWVNMQMGSSSKLQWNSPGERQSRTRP